MNYLVVIDEHTVTGPRLPRVRPGSWPVAAFEGIVRAEDAPAARRDAASRACRAAGVPPFRSLSAQTAERARATVHESPAEERARKMRERGR